jgi:serine/threonine protein kinase
VDSQGNRRVAIKELKRSGENFESVAEGEAAVLEKMRGFQNDHLIKAIAYYQKGREYYFMFPWAELGNLWEFWKNHTPKTERNYIIWVFTQLTGLASAVEALHHEIANTAGANCRHGDLKPANILCFKTKGGQEDNPRLVITDVGLARLHNVATERRDQTLSTAATVRYAAPELGINPKSPRSRRFDVWSMGCIFLEFVIWLLYDAKELQQFCSDPQQPFYDFQTPRFHPISSEMNHERENTARVHPMVEQWISHIKNDWRCSEGTALQRLVELIVTRLLKVEVNNPSHSKDNYKRTSLTEDPVLSPQRPNPIIADTLTQEPTSTEMSVPTMAEPETRRPNSNSNSRIRAKEHARTWDKTGMSTIDAYPDPNYRAYAPEIRERLRAILDDLESGKIKAIGDKPSKEMPIPLGLSHGRFVEQERHLGVPIPTWVG